MSSKPWYLIRNNRTAFIRSDQFEPGETKANNQFSVTRGTENKKHIFTVRIGKRTRKIQIGGRGDLDGYTFVIQK